MKKHLVVFLAFVFLNFSASASHFMGGEITWKCLKGGPNVGQYIFQMKVYRDCDGITFPQSSQTLDHHNYPALGNMTPILMNFISVNDISSTVKEIVNNINKGKGTISKLIYEDQLAALEKDSKKAYAFVEHIWMALGFAIIFSLIWHFGPYDY